MMRIQRNAVYTALLILIISTWGICNYNNTTVQNIIIGIFSSSFLVFCTSFISYLVERNRAFERFINKLNELLEGFEDLYIGNDKSGIEKNMKLYANFIKYNNYMSLSSDTSEFAFLINHHINNKIKKNILLPIEEVQSTIITHYNMLKTLLYESKQDIDILTQFVKIVRLDSIIPNKSDIKKYAKLQIHTFDEYRSLSNEEKIIYHNNEITKLLFYPNEIVYDRHDLNNFILPILHTEIHILLIIKIKHFITNKRIMNLRNSSKKTGSKWDEISEDIENNINKQINLYIT